MNTLELNKKEVGYLFIITAVVPMFAFIAGIYLSGSSHPSISNEQEQQTIAHTESIKQEVEPIHASPPSIIEHSVDSIGDDKAIIAQLDNSEIPEISYQYDVQAGVFSTISNAIHYQDYLISKGINTEIIAVQAIADTFLYRVVLGSYDSKSEAIQYILSTEQVQELKLDLYIKEINNKTHMTIASL